MSAYYYGKDWPTGHYDAFPCDPNFTERYDQMVSVSWLPPKNVHHFEESFHVYDLELCDVTSETLKCLRVMESEAALLECYQVVEYE